MSEESNGRHATIELVNEKIRALRWEMRAWGLAAILGIMFKFQLPQTVTHTALAFFR